MSICGTGTYEPDVIELEALPDNMSNQSPDPLPKPDKITHTPMNCIGHEDNKALLPPRVGDICRRAILLQRGNVMQTLGRLDEAREDYEEALRIMEQDPRTQRVDWERNSLYLSAGNCCAQQKKWDEADAYYAKAAQLGRDHLDSPLGSAEDGQAMLHLAMMQRAKGKKISGDVEGAKKIVGELVDMKRAQDAKKPKTMMRA
jgi:tetratricopeptide (TPR) repeat protein